MTSIVVPSLNPGPEYLNVIKKLKAAGFKNIITVDDGSNEECKHFFNTAVEKYGAVLLTHEINKGKGKALKTAFNYYLNNIEDNIGVVTVDGDDQHHIDDIIKVAKKLEDQPSKLILGVRDFKTNDIPLRSKIGNNVTLFAMRFFCGVKVSDTQTGLRGIPNAFLPRLLEVPGERYEYETNMLLETKKAAIGIEEVAIKTIYIDGNSTSHFRAIKDSLIIYKQLFKFIISSLISAACDYLLFILAYELLTLMDLDLATIILLATIIARVISSVINYLFNKKTVFTNCNHIKESVYKYYTLAAMQMLASFGLVYIVTIITNTSPVLNKLVIDTGLFLISFQIQKHWVFKPRRN